MMILFNHQEIIRKSVEKNEKDFSTQRKSVEEYENEKNTKSTSAS